MVGFVDGAGETSRRVPDMAGVESFSEAFNAVAVCAAGEVRGVYRKRHLPNYDVFDELRHFRPGIEEPPLFEIGGAAVGVTVCEDAWVPDGPVSDLARAGAQLVVNVNGSPFRAGKQATREQVIGRRVAEAGVAMVCVNLVGRPGRTGLRRRIVRDRLRRVGGGPVRVVRRVGRCVRGGPAAPQAHPAPAAPAPRGCSDAGGRTGIRP